MKLAASMRGWPNPATWTRLRSLVTRTRTRYRPVVVKVVAEALGHSRASFTWDVYMHLLPGMGEQVASAIETALGGEG